MTDEVLRNYLGVVSFLLAALSFVAGERREAIASLNRRGNVPSWEKWLTVASVVGLVAVAALLIASSWPLVHSTGLGVHDLFRIKSALRTAFVVGWVLLFAVELALISMLIGAWKIKTGQAAESAS